jgi:DNA primase
MSRIPDPTIESVRRAVDLVDVVSDYVRLKKQGTRFVGLCPFHNEKTPSFSVDPRQDLFYCFGCKKGGDLFKFVEEIEGVGFLDAVRLLADRAGIEIMEEEGSREEANEREAMLAALRFAARYYFDQLKQPSGKRGLAYLRERGFKKETIKAFGIGYAPDAWDALLKAATAAGFKPDVLEDVGLVKPRQSGDGHYDVFRDRLMFPILDRAGKVLGFGGRILPGSSQESDDFKPAKYINTPETAVFHKGQVLFGLKQAKLDIRREEEVVFVEGYADVVSLHQAGIKNVVASSGTALTAGQIRSVVELARTAVLLYDADAAGVNAALKGIEAVLRAGLAVYVVALPDGADPDSFVRQFGAERGTAFRNYLREHRQDFVAFIARQARKEGLFASPEGKAEAARRLLDAVALVRDPIAQDAYLLRAAAELGVPDMTLRPQLRRRLQERSDGRVPSGPPPSAPPDATPVSTEPARVAVPILMRPEEAVLLRLMLEHGAPMVEHVLTRMALDEFSEGTVREFVGHLLAQYEAGEVDAEPFRRGDCGEVVQRLAAEVLTERHALSENWARRIGIAVPGLDAQPYEAAVSAMRLLKLDRVEEAIEAVKRRVFVAEQEGEDVTALLQQQDELNALKRQIERGAFLEWGPAQG